MQNSSLSKILKVLSWLLMGLSVALTVYFFVASDFDDLTQVVVTLEPFIIWAYILFGLAALLALAFPLYFFIRNPKNALKTLLGIALMAVVALIGYIFADPTPIYSTTSDPNFSITNVLVLTDTGLIATYILFGVALVLMLFTGVRSVFHK